MKRATFERAFGGEDHDEWIKWQPSVVSGKTPCVAAHVRGGGVAYRADACWTVPMTYAEHQEMHNVGQKTYAARHGLDLDALAVAHWAAFQHYLTTQPRLPW